MLKTTFLAALALALLAPSIAYSQDALQILPTRIVFANERSAELTLINRGSEAGNYRILLRNIRTDDYGQFQEATDVREGEKFADQMIRYSPRSVMVEPDSNQKVRLVVRVPRDQPPGEYRTHMVFQSLPKEVPSVLGDNGEVVVSVEPIVEVSIPVIVRVGELDARIELGDVKLEDNNQLSLQIRRDGNRSLYGDIEVFVDSGQAKGTQAGFVKGVSVYVPNPVRNFLLPLNMPAAFNPGQDALLVRFKEDPTYGGEQVVEYRYSP